MHDPNTICPRHTDGRGIKKEREEAGEREGAAEVSDFFIKNPNLKIQYLSGGGGKVQLG